MNWSPASVNALGALQVRVQDAAADAAREIFGAPDGILAWGAMRAAAGGLQGSGALGPADGDDLSGTGIRVTRLDVTDESLLEGLAENDPRAVELALYAYLSWLQEQVVEALSAGLS